MTLPKPEYKSPFEGPPSAPYHWCGPAGLFLKGEQQDCVCARRRFNAVPANVEEARKLAIFPGDPRYETALYAEEFIYPGQ